MKTIFFNEYSYVLHKYPVEMKISEEDYKNLKKDLDLESVLEKNDYDFEFSGESETLYDFDTIFDCYDDLELEEVA